MDTKRLVKVLFQRLLAPSYIGTVLWFLTDYLGVMIGGVALSVVFTVAYPFLQPVAEVLHEEVAAQRQKVQAQRRTQLLETFLPFLHAYKAVLTKYPPALLSDAAPEVSTQLQTCLESFRRVKERRLPYTAEPYETVEGLSLTLRDFEAWTLRDCKVWMENLLTALAAGQIAALAHAVRGFARQPAGRSWKASLAMAERDLDREAERVLLRWRCIQRAREDPEVQKRLVTLLRLDAFNRQAGLQPYLASRPLQCSPGEVYEVMEYMRYEPVAAKVLALVEASPGGGLAG
jgi:hypothetical protein